MNCRDFDELAARRLEGVASEEEILALERHAASCAHCRASLAEFDELERSLVSLKETIPPWNRAEARLMRSTSRRAPHPLLGLIWNPPVVCGLLFVVLGLVLSARSRSLAYGSGIVGSGLLEAVNGLGLGIARLFSNMGRLDFATLAALGLALTVVPLVAFGFAMQRFGRR